MHIYACDTRTHTHTYIYITYINSDTSMEPSLRAAVPTPKAPRKPVPTRVRMHARIGGAAAHNRPRGIEAWPSASAIVRAAGPGAAHTEANMVTDAVFHAPMFALNADAEYERNACAPKPPRGPCRRARARTVLGLGFQAEPAARARQRVRIQPIHHHRTLVHAYMTPTDSHIYR
jgi:hypothetical protein